MGSTKIFAATGFANIVSALKGFLTALYDVNNLVAGFIVVDVPVGVIACSADATGFSITPAYLLEITRINRSR